MGHLCWRSGNEAEEKHGMWSTYVGEVVMRLRRNMGYGALIGKKR